MAPLAWGLAVGAAALDLLYQLIFPVDPFAPETAIPPYYDAQSQNEPLGAQCAKRYGLVVLPIYQGQPEIRYTRMPGGDTYPTLAQAQGVGFRRDLFLGPIKSVSWQVVATALIQLTVVDQTGVKQYALPRYYNNSTLQNETINFVYYWAAIDGVDNCGVVPPNPNIPTVPIPIYPPDTRPRERVPVPTPPPTPPAPPIQLPPIVVPIINFDFDVNVDLDVNFKFDTTINFNFGDGNGNDGGGEITIPDRINPDKLLEWLQRLDRKLSLALQRLDYLTRAVKCLEERLCVDEGQRFYRRLGDFRFNSYNLFGWRLRQKEVAELVTLTLTAHPQGVGRRARRGLPNLYSPQSFGYYALQRVDGSFGAPEEIRFLRQSVLLSEQDAAVVVYPEPDIQGRVFLQTREIVRAQA